MSAMCAGKRSWYRAWHEIVRTSMGTIPEGYTLQPHINAKKILRKKYQNWTVGDLMEFLADVDPTATLWVEDYDEAADDLLIRPVEFLSSNGRKGYVMVG